ncbi:MAG: YCF48-related protein [Bacteroidota bacterium]|nr:YCF48-related protein [Bacteroidota bacterium]
MKKTFFGFVALLVIMISGCKKTENLTGQETPSEWKLVRENQNDNYYHALSFIDQHNGCVVGDSGKILTTNDGGNLWHVQESGTTVSLKCVYFANTQKGWIGGGNNSIGLTTNGGITWIWQHPAGESSRTFMAMSFINEYTGWVVDNYSGILHTEDGGMTWTPQSSGTTWAITSVQFLDAKEGWAVATNRVVLHTTDGGDNWTTNILDTINYGNGITAIYSDIYFYNQSKGWIATNVGASSIRNPIASIVRTSDTGNTWNCQSTPEELAINSIQFVNENFGWAGCFGGILFTTNSGKTWDYQFSKTDDIIVDICFVDQSHGWALSFNGSIYRYQAL